MPSASLRSQFAVSDQAGLELVRAKLDAQRRASGPSHVETAAELILHGLAESYIVARDGESGRLYGVVLKEVCEHLPADAYERLLSSNATLGVAQAALTDHPFQAGRAPTLLALLNAGLSANARTIEGDLPLLFVAAKAGATELAEILLRYGADLEATTTVNETPLVGAVQSVDHSIVRLLLDKGADATQCVGSGMDVLLVAIAAGQGGNVVAALHGAGVDMHEVRKNGQTPIVAAASYNNDMAIRELAKLGVDVDAELCGNQKSPLSVALASWNFASALALIECGAKFDAIATVNLEEGFSDGEARQIRSAIAEKTIFLSASVSTCPENVHNGQNEGNGSRRSPANFSPL